MVIDPSKDYFNYLHVNNPKARGKLLELISYFDLADIYRELTKYRKIYLEKT